ncbi:MAG TPA: hypothetical protein VM925_01975 [Labilithrix sp.]|nr:hypothetical protein [Labilithrix sp.]
MFTRRMLTAAVLSMSAAGACGVPRAPATVPFAANTDGDTPGVFRPVKTKDLCVATGHLVELDSLRSRVDGDEARATTGGYGATTAELAFTYLGPTTSMTPLASGERRRQAGLKLRAKDTCNVVYVMWRLEPTTGIFVSVKQNPGKSTHAACGADGYLDLKPLFLAPTPHVALGEAHTLRAVTNGDRIRVFADGELAWAGTLPAVAFDFDGPTGIRSDNIRFDFELRDDGANHAGCSAL